MKPSKSRFLAGAVLVTVAAGCGSARAPATIPELADGGPGLDPVTGWVIHQAPHSNQNEAYRWMHIMQEVSGRSVDRAGARPTIITLSRCGRTL